MRANRWAAQRPQEELWLIDAITKNNYEAAETLIQFIQEKTPNPHSRDPHPSLESVDEHGNSFLMLSIFHTANDTADKLFELQKNNDNILFKKNIHQQSLIWQAAESHQLKLLKKITRVCSAKYNSTSNLPLPYLEADDQKNTPLHASVSATGTKIGAFLLNAMASSLKKEAFIIEINKTNLNGDTALHLAMQKKNMPLAALLVKAGADWKVLNNQTKSPFDYFCASGSAEANLLLSELEDKQVKKIEIPGPGGTKITKETTLSDDKYQAQLLNFYQDKVLEMRSKNHSEQEKSEIVARYHQLASMVSLKSLILAKAATDEKFHQAISNQKTAKFVHGSEILLADDDEENTDETNATAKFDDIPLADYQQISEDRGMLTELIKAIEDYVTDLENNPRTSERKKVLAVLLPIITWLTYGGIEAWLVYQSFNAPCKEPHNDHCYDYPDPRSDYRFSKLIFGILGALASVGATIGFPYWLWKKDEKPISDSEWKSLIKNLQESILDKLSALKVDQAPQDNQQTIQALQTEFNALHDNQTRQHVIDHFKQIAGILKKIQLQLNNGYYHKGLTLFKPLEEKYGFEVLQISELDNVVSGEEEESLLANRDNRRLQYGAVQQV